MTAVMTERAVPVTVSIPLAMTMIFVSIILVIGGGRVRWRLEEPLSPRRVGNHFTIAREKESVGRGE